MQEGEKTESFLTDSQSGILFLTERLKIKILVLCHELGRNIQKLNSVTEDRKPSGNWAENH